MQKPSVAGSVHYVAYGTPGGEFEAGVHRAAIVTDISICESDDAYLARLCVLNPTGMFFTDFLPYDESGNKPGTWHWPERVD